MTDAASPIYDFVIFLMTAGVILWFIDLLFKGGKK